MVRFPAVAHFNFLDFPENFKNCFRLHRKRRNPGCSLAVEYLYIHIYCPESRRSVEYLPGKQEIRGSIPGCGAF